MFSYWFKCILLLLWVGTTYNTSVHLKNISIYFTSFLLIISRFITYDIINFFAFLSLSFRYLLLKFNNKYFFIKYMHFVLLKTILVEHCFNMKYYSNIRLIKLFNCWFECILLSLWVIYILKEYLSLFILIKDIIFLC